MATRRKPGQLRESRYGLLGARVGEASHPDTDQTRNARRLQSTLVDSDACTADQDAADRLRRDGVNTSSWEALERPPVGRQERFRERNPTEPVHGWQKEASSKVHKNLLEKVVWQILTAGESIGQVSKWAPFTSFPVCRVTRVASQPSRVLLLRRHLSVHSLSPSPSTRRSWPTQGSLWQGRGSWQTWFRQRAQRHGEEP